MRSWAGEESAEVGVRKKRDVTGMVKMVTTEGCLQGVVPLFLVWLLEAEGEGAIMKAIGSGESREKFGSKHGRV